MEKNAGTSLRPCISQNRTLDDRLDMSWQSAHAAQKVSGAAGKGDRAPLRESPAAELPPAQERPGAAGVRPEEATTLTRGVEQPCCEERLGEFWGLFSQKTSVRVT